MKRRIAAAMAGALILAGASVGPVLADTQSDLQNQQQQIKQQQQQLHNELDEVSAEAAQAYAELQGARAQEAEAQEKLDAVNAQVAKTEKAIAATTKELARTEAELKKKQEAMAARVRALQEEGRISYLDVLINSTDFGEFLTRWDFFEMVVQQDVVLFRQVKEAQAKMEAQKAELETQKADLVAQRQVAVQLRDQLAAVTATKQRAYSVIDNERARVRQAMADLEAQSNAIARRIADLARQANRKPVNGTLVFQYPGDQTLITDDYGPRIHPVTGVPSFHTGTDFNAPMGSGVYAIEAGTVIISEYGWNGGYGNYVVVDHGGGYTSLYAHNSALLVSVGDSVTKGQQIARAGSTGRSTGPHIHLEIRINGSHTDPMQFLD